MEKQRQDTKTGIKKSRSRIRKVMAVFLSFALVITSLTTGWVKEAEKAEAAEILDETQVNELYSQYFGADKVHKRVSVHDPSIVVGYQDTSTKKVYSENAAGRQKIYCIFGSHMAWAYSYNLEDWTTFTNNINTDYATLFAKEAKWSALGSSSYDLSGNLWAPDIVWNPTMNKWCMYMSVNGDQWYTSVVMLTADDLLGDWTYVGPVVFSGFTVASDSNAKNMTDLFDIIGSVDGTSSIPDRYRENRNGNATYGMNAIDPCVFYDTVDGKTTLWMTYGSWFGGIYMLELDQSTGLRDKTHIYTTKADLTEDIYQGIKIAGGGHKTGEASYIEKIGNKYYLFMSYGGLTATVANSTGYNMRVFFSDKVTGPYKDLSGDDARYYLTGEDNKTVIGNKIDVVGTIGSRLMSFYRWSFMDKGFVAQGHNSVFVDTDGKIFNIYHTRRDDGTEGHEVRVHQTFVAGNDGLVTAPFEYSGETLSTTAYAAKDVAGDYQILYMDPTKSASGLTCVQEETLNLSADGKVSGTLQKKSVTGTWVQTNSGPYVTMTIGSVTYQGVFLRQNIEETGYETMCFTVVGNDDIAVWGYQNFSDKACVVKAAKELNVTIPSETYLDLTLPVSGELGTAISWKSSNTSALGNDGKVQSVTKDTAVTLTATISKGDYSYKQPYNVTVKVGANADITTGLDAFYQFDGDLVNSINTTQVGFATSQKNGTAPTLEYNGERGSSVLHQYFGYAGDNDSVLTISYTQFPNPLKGKTLTGATVSLWVNRLDADVWDAIWSFGDWDNTDGYDGRLYLTPNSYLGYNGTGGFFDCNHPEGNTVSTITPNEWKLVTVTVDAKNFGIYVDGQLIYDKDNNTKYGGSSYTDVAADMLKVIASAADFYLGFGSWWGSSPLLLDNLRIYSKALTSAEVAGLYQAEEQELKDLIEAEKAGTEEITSNSLYYNNYNSAVETGWSSVNAGDKLTMEKGSDQKYKNYVQFSPGNQNSRSAYTNWDISDLPQNYIVEFDTQLTAGSGSNSQQSQLALVPNNYSYSGNDAITNYLWSLNANNSTTWTVSAGETVTIPKATWTHIKTIVKNDEKKATLIITDSNTKTELYNKDFSIEKTVSVNGIYWLSGRYNGVAGFDNIRVWEYNPAEDVTKENTTETLTGTAWWTGTQQGQDYHLGQSGSLTLYVKADALDAGGYGAFSVRVQGKEDGKIYSLFASSDKNTYPADGCEGQGTVTGVPAKLASELIKGNTYRITITRSGQNFTVEYFDVTTGKTYCKSRWTGGSMPEDVVVNIIAQVGTYAVKCSHPDNDRIIEEAEEATCTEPGYTEGEYCGICDKIFAKREEIAALGHKEVVDEGKAATCTVDGITEGKHCSVCNEVLVKQEVIVAKGHTEVIDAAKDPTCTDPGKTEGKHCSVCNEVTVAQEEIEALGHSYTSTVTKPATEEEEGVRTYTCNRCDDTYTDVIPKLPAGHVHDYVETVVTEPSCIRDGVNKFVCDGCGDEYTEPSPALGHTEVVDEAVEPTCTKPGKTEGKHCSVCEMVLVIQTTILALGHTEVVDEAVEATCAQEGKTEGKHCSVCNEVLVEQEVIPAKSHTEVVDEAVEATCTEPGKTEGKHCSVCNEILKEQEEVKALGHSYDEGKVTKPATVSGAGIKTYTCTRCGDSYTEEIEKLPNPTTPSNPITPSNPVIPSNPTTPSNPATSSKPSDSSAPPVGTQKPDDSNTEPGNNTSGTPTPSVTTKPDGTVVTTTTEKTEDGEKETVKEEQPDGTVIETVKEQKPDGTSIETVKEQKPDGASVETVKEQKPDGSSVETVKEQKTDGSSIETVREETKEGAVIETVREETKEGTVKENKEVTPADKSATLVTASETDASGKTSANAVIKTGITNTAGTVAIAPELLEDVAADNRINSVVVEITETTVNSSVSDKNDKTAVQVNIPAIDGVTVEKVVLTRDSIAAAKETGKGLKVNVVTVDNKDVVKGGYTVDIPVKQLAKIDPAIAEINITIEAEPVTDVADTSKKNKITKIVNNNKGKTKKTCVVSLANNKDVKAGMNITIPVTEKTTIKENSKVYVYRYDAKTGKLYEVANSKKTVSKDGSVTIAAVAGNTDFVVSAKKLNGNKVETIKDNISVAVSKKTAKAKKKVNVKVSLPDTVSTKKKFGTEKAKITYTTGNKKVATVSKKGVVTTKKKGKVVIKTTIKLESGQKITKKQTIKVK